MPAIGYPYSFYQGLSDFWTRFFADSSQLQSLYKGSAILIGQAYLDLMSATVSASLKDALVFDREYFKLLTVREDQMYFVEGGQATLDRWALNLEDPLVDFPSLDNRVYEPTASLEVQRDFTFTNRVAMFKVDPTDPSGTGIPLDGFARRALDIEVGGSFDDDNADDWLTVGVKKGDTLRVLDIGTDGAERKRTDHSIILVRPTTFYVDASTPFSDVASDVKYAVLRVPATPAVVDTMTMSGTTGALVHARVDQGSLRIYAKNASGADVVEGVDYIVNYEAGTVLRISASPWQGDPGPYGVTYTWRIEVAFGLDGEITATTTTTRVIQIAAWAPDARVDRRTLSNNFGTLIGRESLSSEAYRAFLQGIFQLYLLGPVLERVESALNVVLGLPVVGEDGEVIESVDTTDPLVNHVITSRSTYTYPKGVTLRDDLVAGLALVAFEPLTEAVVVTDYVETPNWWHGSVIPAALFSPVDGSIPSISRRTANANYVAHVYGAADGACYGDPGLYYGADETGFVLPPGQPLLRRRMAFVLMDRHLKYHTFTVAFDAAVLSLAAGAAFAQSIKDLNDLVIGSKPSHTYAFTKPSTSFTDEIALTEDLSFDRQVGSRVFGPDQVVFADHGFNYGAGVWAYGDYFKYETVTSSTAFPALATPVTLSNAPIAPRHGRLVRVHVDATIGGKRVIENVDYAVNYATREVERLTAWDSTTEDVTFVQLNIGNLADAAAGVDDMPIMFGGIDPSIITAEFDPAAAQWDGVVTPQTAPRDIALVERALIVSAHP